MLNNDNFISSARLSLNFSRKLGCTRMIEHAQRWQMDCVTDETWVEDGYNFTIIMWT